MIPPPSSLQSQYDALNAAIASGVKVVRFQDRTVEYASIDEMIKAANYIYQLSGGTVSPGGGTGTGTTSASGPHRQIRFYTNKGL
jgi:hypothetical protein